LEHQVIYLPGYFQEVKMANPSLMDDPSSVIIIGAGIAGLSTGVYAQRNGYQSRIYEMHNLPGGLMTAWKRKGYTIDGCIHWLSYSNPTLGGYKMWDDIGLVEDAKIFDPELFTIIEGQQGQSVNFYSDVNRLEAHLLELAPEDRKTIRSICAAIRAFARIDPDLSTGMSENLFDMVRAAPAALAAMPYLRKYGAMTMRDLGKEFSNPLLRETFEKMWYPDMSALGLLFTLSMLHNRAAGYVIGGSLPMAHAVEKRYCDLGGKIHYGCRVEEILVEDGRAVGVRLEDGRVENAGTVISAADGYTTIYKMLGGRFIDDAVKEPYEKFVIFPPLIYIGLGVNQEIPEPYGVTGGVNIMLSDPITVAGETIDRLDVMIYNFDPLLAPAGKTVLNVAFPTSYTYWKELYSESERYEAEKQAAAIAVIDRLDRRFPGLAQKVEMVDVATPVTFERYTGNWQGSFEGWIPTPATLMKQLPKTLPGLTNFYMVGQWVQPGGGLPTGVMTAQQVVKMLCKRDKKKFRR